MTISDIGLAETSAFTSGKSSSSTGLQKIIHLILPQFDKILRSHLYFNLIFLSLGFFEFVLLIFFFTFLTQSAILAFSLAVVFLTFFSYFILRLYYQTQKPEQFYELKERYVRACKSALNYQENSPEHFIGLTNALSGFADALAEREYTLISLPPSLSALHSYIEKFSCWYHWHDLHQMRELLLKSAVEENIKLVKHQPTDLDAHAALANSYIMLAGLYIDSKKTEKMDEKRWVPEEAFAPEMADKFRWTSERAVEEFKIIHEFAPEDPWVHIQLAYSYHDLKMPLHEINEYETLIKMDADDSDTLLRLGILYFQQGMNAKGLCIYEKLKEIDLRRAEDLIKYYGTYR